MRVGEWRFCSRIDFFVRRKGVGGFLWLCLTLVASGSPGIVADSHVDMSGSRRSPNRDVARNHVNINTTLNPKVSAQIPAQHLHYTVVVNWLIAFPTRQSLIYPQISLMNPIPQTLKISNLHEFYRLLMRRLYSGLINKWRSRLRWKSLENSSKAF